MKMLMSLLAFAVMLSVQIQAAPVSIPPHRVIVTESTTRTINYRDLKSSTVIDFRGTSLLPGAQGRASIKRKADVLAIEARFEGLPPATQFGSEYLTYVLWAISPEGRPTNLGELSVKRGKSKLYATEQLQTFGLVVTAEPYFAVSGPSNVVVLENALRKDTQGKVESVNAAFTSLQWGHYEMNIIPSQLGMILDPKTPLAVYQARNAVRIARDAGAESSAGGAFGHAEKLLAQMEAKGVRKDKRAALARETVQRAEDARLAAVQRQAADSLANERKNSVEQIVMANRAATKAERGQAVAENAQDLAEIDSATAQVAEGEANAGRAAAEAAAASALKAMGQANRERNVAVGQTQRAEGEKAVLRAQLLAQFSSILQTRDSARGLIVNMSGVLFATEKSDLRPEAREKLAKISGIVLAYPGLRLEVEGHTDSAGSDAFNQVLSEERAEGARDYLVNQGVLADSIVSRGFGSKQPIASNDTPEGRQSNRRVELVVSGDLIQISRNIPALR